MSRWLGWIPAVYVTVVLGIHGQTMEDFGVLIEGARTGDVEQVERALDSGISLYQSDGGGLSSNERWTALDHAADANQPEVVRFLMNRGYDVGLKSTPFKIAARNGYWDVLATLLEGVDLELEREIRNVVIVNGFKILLENGADPNRKTMARRKSARKPSFEETALINAVLRLIGRSLVFIPFKDPGSRDEQNFVHAKSPCLHYKPSAVAGCARLF